MKAWVKKAGGVLLTALLTVMLNGKAYADTPAEEPPVEIQDPAPSELTPVPAAEAFPEVTLQSAPVESAAEPVAPAAVPEEPVTVTPAAVTPVAEEEPPAATLEAPAEPPEELPAASPEAQPELPAEENPAPAAIEEVTPPEIGDTPAPVQDNTEAPVLPEIPSLTALSASLGAPQPGAAIALSTPAPEETVTPKSGTETPSESTESGEGTETVESTETLSFRQTEDGSYVLVNHIGTESLSAEGDITVLAAGLNHVSSISGSGTVRIAGTGILLVDSLEGNLELQTFTDIYEEGSAAVFVKQEDGTYLLKNGTVPGILDEEYKVEGVTLVMPEQTSLHLIGTGALPKYDGDGNITEVTYYHGTEHTVEARDYEEDFKNAVESTGKLTIGRQAALLIRKGASILMENLKGIGREIMPTELNITDGGTLTVEEGGILGQEREDNYGSIIKDGFVTLSGEAGTLSGSGSITADWIVVKDPDALTAVSGESPGAATGCEITFSANELQLESNGEENSTIDGLRIKDCTVFVESNAITVSGLSSAGNSTVVLPSTSKLDIAEVEGTLHLSQREYYNVPAGEDNYTEYNDNKAQTISGEFGGSGTICFDSGIYIISEGTTAGDVSFSTGFGGLVYDYGGLLPVSHSPLHMQPSNAERADANGGEILVVAAKLGEIHSRDGVKTVEIKESVELNMTLQAESGTEGPWTLQLSDVKEAVKEAKPAEEYSVVVEILRKDTEGRLHTDFCALKDLPDTLAADDICLLRVSYVVNVEPVAPSTNTARTGTTFTGSGILGGSGAGSVTIGNPHSEDSNHTGDDPDPAPDPGPTPQPDPAPDPGPTPQPDSETKPVPLVAQVTGDAQQQAPVWAEASPGGQGSEYVVLALEGEKTLEELGGTANVSMKYALPEKYAGKQLYVVFRNEDGTLTALRASWSKVTGLLRFLTDRLGTFTVVGFDFDGEEFSGEFYAALEALPELKNLAYADYSPV